MTAEEVIELANRKARAAGVPWTLEDNGYIRCGDCCPLELAGDWSPGFYLKAANDLGVQCGDRWVVIDAADGNIARQLPTALTRINHLRALMLATFDFADGAK